VDPSQDYGGSGLCDAGAGKSMGCVFVSIDMLCTIGIVDGKRGIRNLTKGTSASYINPTRCSSRAKSPSQAKSSIWSST